MTVLKYIGLGAAGTLKLMLTLLMVALQVLSFGLMLISVILKITDM